MGKDARLSFRISSILSDRIDKAIDKSDGQIRDRSEFGTKAIKFYLDYIENTQSEDEIILKAILTLANHVGEKGADITKIEKILEERTMIPYCFFRARRANCFSNKNIYKKYKR